MIDLLNKKQEKVLLVSVDLGDGNAEASIAELAELVRTAGAEVAATVTQARRHLDPATCVGAGKIQEIKEAAESLDADPVIFDRELSPTQIKNIEDALDGRRIIDRTTLILDIFALRAKTAEGKLQVEIAQLKHRLPRLTGRGAEMSRLGGGIGTRGPGESKLETDKRHLKKRILLLTQKLKELESRRRQFRERRQKDRVICAAIAGYTNAGKSTLLNKLTASDVLAEDKLFATLDPTARNLHLPSGQNITLIDTVGFIRDLPHSFVEAFKSTLEEVKYADLIINLADASDKDVAAHISVVSDILTELNSSAPVLPVYNKCDRIAEFIPPENSLAISAKTGQGIPELLTRIGEMTAR